MGEQSTIAKNTLFLYIRMLLTMAISLYTSRVILRSLGIEDYGIYNVVGGLVTLFSMVSGSVGTAISRFLTFEIGKNNEEKLKKVFSASVTIQLLLSLIVVFLGETIGLWFLNAKMTIPAERINAANWCYQLSLLTFCIDLFCIPYLSSIIAHEKMSAFAYISILEATGKLCIAWLIAISLFDKLIFYAILITILAVAMRVVYMYYCKQRFIECHFQFAYDKKLLAEMFSFAGWNYIGAIAYVLHGPGINVIMNLFFGPIVNTARGIATQVESSVYQFVTNFTTAVNPQIIKSYAQEKYDYLYRLICAGAKYSYFLMLILVLPIIFEAEMILNIWLKDYPTHTIVFLRLTLIYSILRSLSTTFSIAMQATGKIKKYQIINGGISLLILPVTYLFYYFGYEPYYAYIACISFEVVLLLCRSILIRQMILMPVSLYIKEVIVKIIIVTVIAIVPPVINTLLFEQSFIRLIINFIVSVIFTSIFVITIGMNVSERNFLKTKLKSIYAKYNFLGRL